MNPAEPLRTCIRCNQQHPEADFVGARGFVTATCSACRVKYYRSSNRSRADLGLGSPSRTESVRQMSALARAHRDESYVRLTVLQDDNEADITRPRTRGECANVPRPCPFVSCRHHLYLDRYPDAPEAVGPEDMAPEQSCALDIADDGASSLDDIGTVLGFSRERARQVEEGFIAKLRRASKHRGSVASVLRSLCDVEELSEERIRALLVTSKLKDEVSRVVERDRLVARPSSTAEVKPDNTATPVTGPLYDERPEAEEDLCAAVWRMYQRDSNSRGHKVPAGWSGGPSHTPLMEDLDEVGP